MKRTSKSFLTTALILFVAGLLLSLCSFLYAVIAGVDVYGIEKASRTVETVDVSLAKIMENSPESDYARKLVNQEFSRIDLLSYAGTVEIRATEGETHVVLTNANTDNIRLEVVGSTLTVAEKNDVGFMGIYIGEKGFSFRGLRQIFGPGNSANRKKVMTIYLNAETVPEEIAIRSSIGNVLVEKIQAGLITLNSFYGTVELDSVTANKVEAKKTLGDLVLTNNHCTGFNASVRFGDLKATLGKEDASSIVADVWMGSFQVETKEALSRYKLNLTTSFGSVTKNEEHCEKNLQLNSSTANRISASVLFGNIAVSDGGQPDLREEEPTETATLEEPATEIPPEANP